MKKMILAVTVIATLVFAGCQSTPKPPVMFDPSVPEDQCFSLSIPNYVTVVEIDGKEVNYTPPLLSLNLGMVNFKVLVPAGEHVLVVILSGSVTEGMVMNGEELKAGTDYRLNFPGEFEAGATYEFNTPLADNTAGSLFGGKTTLALSKK